MDKRKNKGSLLDGFLKLVGIVPEEDANFEPETAVRQPRQAAPKADPYQGRPQDAVVEMPQWGNSRQNVRQANPGVYDARKTYGQPQPAAPRYGAQGGSGGGAPDLRLYQGGKGGQQPQLPAAQRVEVPAERPVITSVFLRDSDDCPKVIDCILHGETVLISMDERNVSKETCDRVSDIIFGAAYALHAEFRMIHGRMILVVPHNMQLRGAEERNAQRAHGIEPTHYGTRR